MLTKFIRPFISNNRLLRITSFKFSSPNLTPNNSPSNQPNNNLDKEQLNIQPPNKQQPNQKPQQNEPQDPKLRAQAKIRVCRSQLGKFAKAELDYEKLNSPNKQIQTVTKYLKNNNIKVKFHSQFGPILQFHRSQQLIRKKSQQKKQTVTKDDNKNAEQQKKQQQFLQQLDEQQQQQDIKLQVKIFTRGVRQLSNSQNAYFDQYFTKEQQLNKEGNNIFSSSSNSSSNTNDKMSMSGIKKQFNNQLKKSRSGFVNFQSGSINQKQVANFVKMINKSPFKLGNIAQNNTEAISQQIDTIDDRFKQFSLYIRNANNKSINPHMPQKWAKLQLIVEEWKIIHLYKISVVNNIQSQLKNNSQSSCGVLYGGVEAKQLDEQLLQIVQSFMNEVQYIWPQTLSAVYYYSGLYEHQYYKKWLQDLVDICK